MVRARLDIAKDVPEPDRALAYKISNSPRTGDPSRATLSRVELERAWADPDRFNPSERDALARLSARLGVPVPRAFGPDLASPVFGEPLRDAKTGKALRRTRIVATVGPACRDAGMLAEMIKAGMDVARINFSHVRTFEEANAIVRALDQAMEKAGRRIAILADLQGPKIRIGALAQPIEMKSGATVKLVPEGVADGVPIGNAAILRDLEVGHRVFVDDGKVALVVTATHADRVEARVIRGGPVGSRKGMNLPDTRLAERVPTADDLASIAIINRLVPPVDIVAASFIESGDDLRRVRAAIGRPVKLVAKVERPAALEEANLDSIYAEADAIMVARGDLAVEIGQERVPHEQDRMHDKGNRLGVPTGVATQMLESMTAGGPPTRAEANDVADAVLDGAEFVMTSGETAIGKDPVDVVRTMHQLVCAAERRERSGAGRKRG